MQSGPERSRLTIRSHHRFGTTPPERLAAALKPFTAKGCFPSFPFGTDFTPEEIVLGKTLKALIEAVDLGQIPEAAMPYLERMQLERPHTLRDLMAQRLILAELKAQGQV